MKIIDRKNELKYVLSNPYENSKGDHIVATCPYCKKEGHLYVNWIKAFKRNKRGEFLTSWDCKRCSEVGDVVKLYRKLGVSHLLKDELINVFKPLINRIKEGEDNENIELILPKIKRPMGFKRIHEFEYLENRGFISSNFDKWEIGITSYKNYNDYLIILIRQEGELVGYIGRNLRDDNRPRYLNSKNTDFNKILIGYDEILFTTKTVVLVEGFFDKVTVDNYLNLDSNIYMKCCCTSGKVINKNHIYLLKKKGVDKLIIIQDPDAIKNTKKSLLGLDQEFDILVNTPPDGKDINDLKINEFVELFNNLKSPFEFFINVVRNNLK